VDHLVTLSADVSKLEEQIAELLSCFPDGIPHELIGDVEKLFSSVILGEFTTTFGADKVIRYLFCPRFGSRFEDFLAAIRANKSAFHTSSCHLGLSDSHLDSSMAAEGCQKE
jgi:hypothetical protein